jgi:hypothetical protein
MNSYNKWRALTPEQLQRAIDDRKVTVEYLTWLGIAGPGKQLREIIAEEDRHEQRT